MRWPYAPAAQASVLEIALIAVRFGKRLVQLLVRTARGAIGGGPATGPLFPRAASGRPWSAGRAAAPAAGVAGADRGAGGAPAAGAAHKVSRMRMANTGKGRGICKLLGPGGPLASLKSGWPPLRPTPIVARAGGWPMRNTTCLGWAASAIRQQVLLPGGAWDMTPAIWFRAITPKSPGGARRAASGPSPGSRCGQHHPGRAPCARPGPWIAPLQGGRAYGGAAPAQVALPVTDRSTILAIWPRVVLLYCRKYGRSALSHGSPIPPQA